jgi:glucosamine 6-phosphate synthetase-like amidotransferase/phosphosugar isomerase protein
VCGIGGVSASYPFTRREAEMCWRLLASLQRRGWDAWGYFDGRKVYKEPGAFGESPKAEGLVDEILASGTNLFLCHTRYATKGDPAENKNNHPFELGGFVFAHNGIIYYSDDFENKWGIETDSFALLYWIWAEYGGLKDEVEAVRAGIRHVSGVYACWLWSPHDGAAYLWRLENPIMGTCYWGGKRLTVFGSDWLSVAEAFGTGRLMRVFKFMAPEVKGFIPKRIYRLKDGVLMKVGDFEPRRLSYGDLRDFEARYGRFMRYHLPGVSGEVLK